MKWIDCNDKPINGHKNWIRGEKAIGWNGYAFEIEWDGEHWCNIGGDEPTHWMLMPKDPE